MMGFKFDIGGVFDEAAKAADAAKKAAGGAVGAAGNAIVDITRDASEAVGKTAGTVAEGLSSAGEQIAKSDAGRAVTSAANSVVEGVSSTVEGLASSDAGKVVAKGTEFVGTAVAGAATAAAGKAAEAASGVAAAVDSGIKVIQENSFAARLKKARIEGFKNGIMQGAYLAGQKRYNFIYAYVATLCYFLRCDGEFSEEEREWLQASLDFLKLDGGLPDEVKAEIQAIADKEDATFDDVKIYLDKVSIVSLDSIAEQIQAGIEADGQVTEEEEHANRLFADYVATRAACVQTNDDWADKAVDDSVREYAENLDRIDREFQEKTKLQGPDLAFLMGATMLQVVRVLVINALTEVEVSGRNNVKEEKLHEMQSSFFSKFDDEKAASSSRLYASKHHILTNRGVPYDATRYEDVSYKLFKGANHRFATLGHDPVLGLLFGTSNIMTNSITCVKSSGIFGAGIHVPVTHNVHYDLAGKNPQIGEQVGTIEMLATSAKRVLNEPDAASFALLKQLVHIGTDLYTPCGIQLPFANLILDKAHAEKLTAYVSTGDVMKVGVQAGMAALINWLIAALHGCSLVFQDDGSDYAVEMYQTRTKKILLISNAIATSSSVVQAAILKNPKCLDLGGAAVLVYRLFSDGGFISQLKREYVNAELDAIYEPRAAGLL